MPRSLTHNLATVIGFEVRRTLRRPSFWLTALVIPLLFVGLFALSASSGSTVANASNEANQPVTFTYTDASGLVDPAVAKAAGGTPTTDGPAARQAVIDGRADMFVAYPADPATQPVEVAAKDAGLIGGPPYASIANGVLKDSAKAKVGDARVASVLQHGANANVITYAEGRVAPGFASIVLPGFFVALFYLAIIMLGNQMLNITVEEKENRVTEMILTTISPTTLILGKIIAVLMLGIVQGVVAFAPMALAAPLLARSAASDPDLADAPLPTTEMIVAATNWPAVGVGLLLFIGSFLLFTGLLVAVGSVMPTAKDAGSAFAALIMALFLPVYTFGQVIAQPHGLVSTVLTYFPLTAPLTAMMRNAMGTLTPLETALVLLDIFGFAALFIALGVRLFRTGSISYGEKLNPFKVLRSSARDA